MIILVHAETDESSLSGRLGRAEYSYFFVLRAFRPVLERIGLVIPVSDPAREVDRLWAQARTRGEPCVYLSFAPPHRTQMDLACPTIPVFAWEFDSLPDEAFDGDPRHDWLWVLRRLGCAIVHAQATAALVRQALGESFAVQVIPAPVWDSFATGVAAPAPHAVTLSVAGTVIDTWQQDFAALRTGQNWVEAVQATRERQSPLAEVALQGVIYSSVFNPEDGRKNWPDMISAFCRAFRETPEATLVLKLTHHDGTWGMALMLQHLVRLAPFRCRVVLVHGFLPDADYARLVSITSFAVNCSHGEGQCLPLMEAMSAGKPAVAPPHTGMADYVNPTNAFLVGSSAEPASWPQDPRHAIRTRRQRIDHGSLETALRDSFAVAIHDHARYGAMQAAASDTLRAHCSAASVEARLRTMLDRIALVPDIVPGLRRSA